MDELLFFVMIISHQLHCRSSKPLLKIKFGYSQFSQRPAQYLSLDFLPQIYIFPKYQEFKKVCSLANEMI